MNLNTNDSVYTVVIGKSSVAIGGGDGRVDGTAKLYG